MFTKNRVLFCLVVAIPFMFCAAGLVAQVTTCEIVGTVTDSSGAVLLGAGVTATNLGTGTARTMRSNQSGDYALTLLPVGSYSVVIEAQGFKKFEAPNVQLSAGDKARVDAKMQLGAMNQTVEVSAQSGALQTDTSTVGGLVTKQSVQDLPLNGRNVMNLVTLTVGASEAAPGELSSGNSPDDRRETSAISANGQGAMSNNYLVDGVDDNSRAVGTIGIKPSIDAIEEVKVQTSLFPADVGRVAGAVVNMISKSGTNTLHGSLFEFVRNDKVDAKDFFNVPQAGNPLAGIKPEYRQNQFGGSLGGAISKNKMFFFGDYEGLRIIKGLTNAISIPTPCQLGRSNCNGVTQIGNFSDMLPSTLIYDSQGAKPTPFPNNVIPLSRINAVGQNFANLFPTAGSGSCSATTLVCSFVNNQPRTQSADQFDSRIDRYFGEKGMLFGRYSYNNTNTYTPSMLPPETVAGIQVSPGGGTVAYPGPAHQRYQQATVSHVHVFSPALLLELKFGYLRGTLVSLPLNYGVNIATAFGLSGLNLSPDTSGMPNITFANGGYSAMGNASYIPLRDSDNSFSYLGNLKWIKGSHAFSFGGSVVRRRYDNYQSQSPLGIFQFSSQQTNSTFGGSGGSGGNSLASLLLGTAASISRTLSLVALQYRMWEDAAYVQDDWRIRSWLTLNLGLRWDLFTPFVEKHDHLSNFDPTDPATLAGAKMLRIRKSISFTTEVSCGDGSCSSIRREICWASD